MTQLMLFKKRVLHNMRNFAQLGKIKAFNVESELIEDLLNKNLRNQFIINFKLESFKFSIKKYFENGLVNQDLVTHVLKQHYFFKDMQNFQDYFDEIKICKMDCFLKQLQLKIADFPFDLINIEQMVMSMSKIDLNLRVKDYIQNEFFQKDQNHSDIQKDLSTQIILDVNNKIHNLKVTLGLSVVPSLKYLEQSIRQNIQPEQQDDNQDEQSQISKQKSADKSKNSLLNVSHSMINIEEQQHIQKVIKYASKKQFIQNVIKDFQNNRKIEKMRFQIFLYLNLNIEHFQFNLLNGTSPYQLDAIQIEFEQLYLKYQRWQLSLILQEFLVSNKIQNPVSKIQKQAQEKIVQIPKIEVSVAVVWEEKSKELTIVNFFNMLRNIEELQKYIQLYKYFLRVKVNIPNIQKNVFPSIFLKLELINYILTLPVLQADFLLRNNIIIIPTKDEKKSQKNKNDEIKQQYFNYLEFISSYMNYQLNAAKNVYMKCNFISIRVCINSMIILLFQDDQLESQEDKINKQIKGIQTVIDIMKFYAKIDKKTLTACNFTKKRKKNNSLQVWDLKRYKGEIKCLYSSFYRDAFDLEIKPETLKKKRRQEFKHSMTNPVQFAEFFMLPKPEIQDFKFSDNIVNSLFNKNWFQEEEPLQQEEEEEPTELFYQLQELEFHYNKIFFKIENVSFQNDKQIQQNQHQKDMFEKFNILKLKKIDVDHFFCINGFKLIVSNTLKELCKNMALKIINNINFQTKKRMKRKKKQAEANVQEEEQSFTIDDEFQFRLRKKVDCIREFMVAFTIEKPQLNIYDDDSKTQILLASKNQSFGLFYQKILPLDDCHEDPKMHVKMFFNEMQLFTAPQGIDAQNRAFWLEHSYGNHLDFKRDDIFDMEQDEIKQGILNRILKTDSCLFDYGFFKNPVYPKDFSRPQKQGFVHYPIFWNTEKRITKFNIQVNQIDAYFDNINLSNFFLLTNFFVKIVESEKENFKKKEPAIKDIEFKDMKTIENKLYNEAQKANLKDKNAFKMKSMFIAQVKKFNLTLLTKEQVKFLGLNLEGLDTEMRFNESKFNETDISIKSFDIYNLLDANLEEEYFFQVENKECENYVNFRMQISYFNVDGFYEGNKWRIYQNFEFILKPVQVNFTNEIFQHTYDFIWSSQILNKNQKFRNDELEEFDKAYLFDTKQYIKLANRNKKQSQKEVLTKQQKHSIKPEYFRRFKFHQMNLKINYASGSALTKLNNFKCTLKPYEFRDRFAPVKDIFDQYFKFIGESIVLSLLKYKFMIKTQKNEKEQDKSMLE